MSITINRRKFLTDTSLSAAGILLAGNIISCTSKKEHEGISYDIMKEVMKYRKFDAHAHVGLHGSGSEDADRLIEYADLMRVEKLQISMPGTKDDFSHEEVRRNNDIVFAAMKQHPDRFIGFFTLNPVFQKESLEEIKRCIDLGMSGYKGYTQVKINHPLYYPVIEKLIDHKMICMMHTECQLGVGGYRMKYDTGVRPNATIPEDMAEAAGRYPEALFQWAHIASFDFEYVCKSVKNHPNIYVDISGSNNHSKQVDFCIEQLGEDRVFFGSDGSVYQAIGKILASEATEEQKKKIFFDNFNNVLRKGGYHVA